MKSHKQNHPFWADDYDSDVLVFDLDLNTVTLATYRLTIPCVTVPVTLPFGGSQIQNYKVEMQQRSGAYVFDLDMNTVKQQ